MIYVDTTFLVDLWPINAGLMSRARAFLAAHLRDTFVVPAYAPRECLAEGASISPQRLSDSLAFLRLFRIGHVGLETVLRHAWIVAAIRAADAPRGSLPPPLRLTAWKAQHATPLAARNRCHCQEIPGLKLIGY